MSDKLRHKDKILLEDHDGVVLIKGQTSYGDLYYAYIKTDKENIERLFRDHKEGKTVDIFSYGDVVEFGKGHEPPEEIRRKVAEKYGSNQW